MIELVLTLCIIKYKQLMNFTIASLYKLYHKCFLVPGKTYRIWLVLGFWSLENHIWLRNRWLCVFILSFCPFPALFWSFDANWVELWSQIYFLLTHLGMEWFTIPNYEFWALENHIWFQNRLFLLLNPFLVPFLPNIWIFFGHLMPIMFNYGKKYTSDWLF